MPLTRRTLLGRGALLVAAGLTAPSFLARTALAINPLGQAGRAASRILVVVQLTGGNDGINTVVPFNDATYQQVRPTLGLTPEEVLPINDSLGFHPALAPLKAYWDQGQLAIVQGVGYPNPNRSHFRSMDIWHSAHPESFERSGWLGRYLDGCRCGLDQPLPAVSVGDQLNGLFWTETTLVPAIANIGAFTFGTDTTYRNDRQLQLQTLRNIYNQAGSWSPYEGLIRAATLKALDGADQLQQVAAGYQSPVDYPGNNGLANQLKMVAQIIHGDLGASLFSVQIAGFDTHANEKNQHANLLGQLGAALDAFVQDLHAMGKQDEVLVMTFSEFGRRVAQNGSAGTDHGTAEPMFLIGGGIQGGLYGSYPSLQDLDDNGDLKFSTDFRSVYAGVLHDHLGVDPAPVLAGSFEPVSVIKSGAVAQAGGGGFSVRQLRSLAE